MLYEKRKYESTSTVNNSLKIKTTCLIAPFFNKKVDSGG